LDLGKWSHHNVLTYAKIIVKSQDYDVDDFDKNVEVDLKHWLGINNFPYSEYH